ncbi:ABC transporter substrate-binding protein [Candidatus Woesearchaeota archaeon]|nr:ABC transporter substrate-binding protein [Candidatus Woesearchaeota archaeon]
MNKTITVMVMFLIGIMVLSGCTQQPEETIKIGYIGPLTGDVAVLGIDASNAIKVAVEEVNAQGGIDGRQVELFIEDDQYSTPKTLSAYNKLVHTNGVETIIVSTYGGLFAIAEKAETDGVLVIDSLDCDQDIANNLPDNTFCIAKETKDLADVIADYAVAQGYQNVGIIHSTVDKFMPSVAEMFKQRVAPSGVTVNIESYTQGTTDFKTQLTKLEDNDAIVYLGYDEIGIAIKQAQEIGIDKPALTIPSVATTPTVQEASQGAIDGIYFSFYAPLEDNQNAKDFYSAFNDMHGRTPYVFVASDHAYDAATILMDEVLPGVDGKTKAERLEQKKQALYAVKNYPGVSGTLSMQADGRISGILIRLYQLQDMAPTYVSG